MLKNKRGIRLIQTFIADAPIRRCFHTLANFNNSNNCLLNVKTAEVRRNTSRRRKALQYIKSTVAAPALALSSKKNGDNQVTSSSQRSLSPTCHSEAANSILHELNYTSVGGLFEAIQKLLLLPSSPDYHHQQNNNGRENCNENYEPLFSKGLLQPHIAAPANPRLSESEPLQHASFLKTHLKEPPLYNVSTLTKSGELERRLMKLQWIGFLQQQVKRTGPTGRHVVDKLNRYMARWDCPAVSTRVDASFSSAFASSLSTDYADYDDVGHALEIDKESFIDVTSRAIEFAATVDDGGRNWNEDLNLLVRSLYPG